MEFIQAGQELLQTNFGRPETYNPETRLPGAEAIGKNTEGTSRLPGIEGADASEELGNKLPDLEETDSVRPATEGAPREINEIQTLNARCEGTVHSETGVPFTRKEVSLPDGKDYRGVFPDFPCDYECRIPEDMYHKGDPVQFRECNQSLRGGIESDPGLRKKFDNLQLEQIENGDTPDGKTWHHTEDPGRMQLVDSDIHNRTNHTGGRSLWGGGSAFR